MSESTGKDQIESFFKKSLENFEDLPSKDLWKDISSQIPVYNTSPVPDASLEISKSAHAGSASNVVQTVTALLAKKAIIISGAVLIGAIGTLVIYKTLLQEDKPVVQKESVMPQVSDSVQIQTIETEATTGSIKQANGTTTQKVSEKSNDKVIADGEVELVESSPSKDTLSVSAHPAAKDTIAKVKEVEEKKEAIAPKKETFYEKNARRMKDSSRNVFSPE